MRSAIISVIKMSWPTIVIVVAILTIMRVTMLLKSDRKRFILHEELFNLLFIIYLMVLFQLVTSQDLPGGGTNLTPFKEIMRYKYGTISFYKQVFGNILLFVPLGFFISKYCRLKNLGGIMLISLLSSLSIETVQHFIGRSFDIDDVILNVCGGVIGFLIYIGLDAIYRHLPKFMRRDWFYNILTIILIALGVLYIVKLF